MQSINGKVLGPVLPFTVISAYCIPSEEILNFTSLIFRFIISCGLADVSLAIE